MVAEIDLSMTSPSGEHMYEAAMQSWWDGDFAKAVDLLRAAIAHSPNVALYHAALGVILKELGQLEPRIACYRRAVELSPEDPTYRANLASALHELGDLESAEEMARQSLTLDSKRAEIWQILGIVLRTQRRWPEAAHAHERAAELKPDWPAPSTAAAQAWLNGGRVELAMACYGDAIERAQRAHDDVLQKQLWQAVGAVLVRQHKLLEAEQAYRRALSLASEDPYLLTDLGNVLKARHRLDEAYAIYRHVVDLVPDDPGALGNLGTIHQSMGQYDAAIRCYRACLSRAPHLDAMWSNLVTCLNSAANHTPQEILAALKEYDLQRAQPVYDRRPLRNDRDPKRPLRIGYLSPDFRRHAVAYFALPLLEGLDPRQFQVFCYYNSLIEDEWTARFKGVARGWVNCAEWDDATLAERIRNNRGQTTFVPWLS